MNELKNAQAIPIYGGSNVAGSSAADDNSPSALASLSGIFLNPVRTFESFRQQPRFFLAACLIAVAVSFSTALIYQRLGVDNIIRAQLDQNATIKPAQKEAIVEMQTRPLMRAIGVVSPIVSLVFVFAAGAAIYLLGVMTVGGSLGYRKALSVWIYSAFPPAILTAVGNILVLFLKSPDQIDLARSAAGLVHANAGVFVDAASHPVLTTAVSSIDLLALYGLVLAIIGLHKVACISPAKASAIVGSIWIVGCCLRIGVSALSNSAMG